MNTCFIESNFLYFFAKFASAAAAAFDGRFSFNLLLSHSRLIFIGAHADVHFPPDYDGNNSMNKKQTMM